MIIAGYPGIGKSVLAQKYWNCIDLDSSTFKVDGDRMLGWEQVYVNVARSLSKSGRIVCVSTHAKVLDELAKVTDDKVVLCFPHSMLRDEWIIRVMFRLEHSGSLKDQKALTRVVNNYPDDILALHKDGRFIHKEIVDININLEDVVADDPDTFGPLFARKDYICRSET